MEHLRDNLRYLRKKAGLTQQQIADKLDVTRAAWGSYEEGRARPPLQIQMEIAKLFSISIDDLLSYALEKRAFRPAYQQIQMPAHYPKVLAITVDTGGKENIEMVAQKAAAGYLNGYADPEYIEELPRFQLPFLPPGTYRAFEITGDSMLPLQPGSIVIGEYVSDWRQIQDGQTYILVSQQDGVVYKRTFKDLELPDRLILRSDNAAYPPFTARLDDMVEIWKARLFISSAPAQKEVSPDHLMTMIIELQKQVSQLQQSR